MKLNLIFTQSLLKFEMDQFYLSISLGGKHWYYIIMATISSSNTQFF